MRSRRRRRERGRSGEPPHRRGARAALVRRRRSADDAGALLPRARPPRPPRRGRMAPTRRRSRVDRRPLRLPRIARGGGATGPRDPRLAGGASSRPGRHPSRQPRSVRLGRVRYVGLSNWAAWQPAPASGEPTSSVGGHRSFFSSSGLLEQRPPAQHTAYRGRHRATTSFQGRACVRAPSRSRRIGRSASGTARRQSCVESGPGSRKIATLIEPSLRIERLAERVRQEVGRRSSDDFPVERFAGGPDQTDGHALSAGDAERAWQRHRVAARKVEGLRERERHTAVGFVHGHVEARLPFREDT